MRCNGGWDEWNFEVLEEVEADRLKEVKNEYIKSRLPTLNGLIPLDKSPEGIIEHKKLLREKAKKKKAEMKESTK